MRQSFTYGLLVDTIARDGAELTEEYYHTTRETIIRYRCKCGTPGEKRFHSIVNSGGAFCTGCSMKNKLATLKKNNMEKYGVEFVSQVPATRQKAKDTMKKRYGVEHALSSPTFRAKAKKTFLEKYGTEHPMQNATVREKCNATVKERYGVDSISQSPEIRAKAVDTLQKKYGVSVPMQSAEIKRKAAATNMEKYGVECVFQSPVIKEQIVQSKIEKYGEDYLEVIHDKVRATNMEKYGVEYPFQLKEIRDKITQTNLARYGVENPFQSEEIKETIRLTNLDTYGVEHAMQNPTIHAKAQKHSYTYKDYTAPSGNIRRVQGYEPFALNSLFYTANVAEEDVITDRVMIPSIVYYYNNRKRVYYPDIFVKCTNTLVEVKSSWTYMKDVDVNRAKANASVDAGYNYEIWVYHKQKKTLFVKVVHVVAENTLVEIKKYRVCTVPEFTEIELEPPPPSPLKTAQPLRPR